MSTRSLRIALLALGLGVAAVDVTPATAQPKAPPGGEYQKVSALVALPDFLPGMGTLYVNPKTLPVGPFLAYGRDGALVSSIYMVPVKDLEAKKAFNMRRGYHEVVRKIRDRRIAVMGCFVFGFDQDTLESFDETIQFVMESRMDLPRYAIAVPFPGTALYTRLKNQGRITTEDWSLYDGQHVVFEPKHMTATELLRHTRRAWKKTYSYGSIWKRLSGSRTRLSIAIPANFGYRFYATHLDSFYTCDWFMPAPRGAAAAGSGVPLKVDP